MPSLSAGPPDRRAALKARHRRGILDAARALMDEASGRSFTVDELAARADVSRRTVFNHFAGVDEIVTTVCSEVLGAAADELEAVTARPAALPAPGGAAGAGTATPDAGPDPATLFDEVVDAVRTTALVAPMAYLTRVLGTVASPSDRGAQLLQRAFSEVSARFSAAMLRRHPGADPVTVHLLVGSVMGGVVVLHQQWHARTGGVDSPASRAVWEELLDRLVAVSRPAPSSSPTA